jgi:hypothetical protein
MARKRIWQGMEYGEEWHMARNIIRRGTEYDEEQNMTRNRIWRGTEYGEEHCHVNYSIAHIVLFQRTLSFLRYHGN